MDWTTFKHKGSKRKGTNRNTDGQKGANGNTEGTRKRKTAGKPGA